MRNVIAVALLLATGCAHRPPGDATRELIADPHDARRHVEIFWSKPPGPGPFPMVVFVHGHQPFGSRTGGRIYVDLGALRSANYYGLVAVAVSQPGYGGSDGPADFCGPGTQDAVVAAIDHLRVQPFVDGKRVVLEGVSRGAIVSAMIAARPDVQDRIAGAVLVAGAYDLKALYDAGFGGLSAWNLRTEAGAPTDHVFADRSAQAHVEAIRAPLLVLHGEQDEKVPVAQATAFAEAIRARGGDVELHVLPGEGHQVNYGKRAELQRAFFARVLQLQSPK